MKIKFIWKIHSDRGIENPEGYFYGVLGSGYGEFWEIKDVFGQTMVLESQIHELEECDLDRVFNNITPEVYESTERSYIKL